MHREIGGFERPQPEMISEFIGALSIAIRLATLGRRGALGHDVLPPQRAEDEGRLALDQP